MEDLGLALPGLCSMQSSRNSIISSFVVTIGGIVLFYFNRTMRSCLVGVI